MVGDDEEQERQRDNDRDRGKSADSALRRVDPEHMTRFVWAPNRVLFALLPALYIARRPPPASFCYQPAQRKATGATRTQDMRNGGRM